MLDLIQIPKTDPDLKKRMETHYSKPKGFVGRSICYKIMYLGEYYGNIVAGSATKHLPNRNQFWVNFDLNCIINNVFYNVSPVHTKYPIRNFTSKVLNSFEEQSRFDWKKKYGDSVIGFESLVLPPRTGELYLRNSWVVIGVTKGFTCRRVSGPSTDGWGGRRIWDTKNIQPKLVLAKKI